MLSIKVARKIVKLFLAVVVILMIMSPFVYAGKRVVHKFKPGEIVSADRLNEVLNAMTQDLSEVMIGSWDIENYNYVWPHVGSGKIVINENGTFDLIEGSFAAIGMGSCDVQGGFCGHIEESQTYRFYTEDVVSFTHYNEGCPGDIFNPGENTAVPRLAKLTKDEIIFVGGGGCGTVGKDRISILTRVNPVPDIPTDLTAKSSGFIVTLSWLDNSDNEIGFKILRKDSLKEVFKEVGSTIDNKTTYEDEVAVAGDYWYRVVATNDNGDSLGSNVVKIEVND